MKKNTKIVSIILFLLSATLSYINAEEKIKTLKIKNIFPTEEEMLKDEFVLGKGINFEIHNNKIYFCSQFEDEIVVFDIDGNYLARIGNFGQGPGDFSRPLDIFIYKDKIFISDNGNARIQVFSLDGEFERQIKIINIMSDFVILKDKIFILSTDRTGLIDRDNAYIFKIFNMKGELLKTIKKSFTSKYNNFIYDNQVILRLVNNSIHCLQQYGTTYRIYNDNGELQKEFHLSLNPLEDKEYKKIKYLWAYKTFCVHDNKIFASYVGKGKIIINVFDMEGKYLFSYLNNQNNNELYSISDMKIIKRNKKKYIYLLLTEPDMYFIIAELE